MGFREALDLSHIVRKYEAFGGTSTAGINYVDGKAEQPESSFEPIPERLYRPAGLPGNGLEPALAGSGPKTCSTSRTMALGGPEFAWDPNRYYRDLGVPWPYVHATRKDLRLAFFEANGLNSRRLTYCLKQLLDPEVRAEYDAMPLGEQYLNDEYVQEALKRRVAEEASRRSGKGDYTTAEQVLDEMGYKIVPDAGADATREEETSPDVIDTDHLKRLDEDEDDQSGKTVGTDWEYSFYLWRTTRWQSDLLAEWQAALITELSEREISQTLTVGLMGKQPHRYAVADVDGDWVVFLNHEEQVSPDLVSSAATALHNEITRQATRAKH